MSNQKTTFLIMRKSGRVNSISVPGCLVGVVLLLLLSGTVLGLLVYYGYHGLHREITVLSQRVKKVESYAAALERSSRPIISLRSLPAVKTPPPPRPSVGASVKASGRPPIRPAPRGATKPRPPTGAAGPPRPTGPSLPAAKNEMPTLKITGFTYSPNSSGLRVSFALENTDGKRSLSGYFFVVGAGRDLKAAVSDPPAGLKDFLPVNYKKGTGFSIRRYKSVRIKLRPVKGMSAIGHVLILIYDLKGDLKVVQTFKVKS